MYDYSGQKCAICQKEFSPGDDVVVCPDCGTPYHRACYEKAGKCVFADRHGAGFEWKPAPGPEGQASAACPACGTANPTGALFCRSCGAPLHSPSGAQSAQQPRYSQSGQAPYGQQPGANAGPYGQPFGEQASGSWAASQQFPVSPDEKLDGIEAKHWAAYIGRSAPMYLLNLKRMELTGRKTGLSFSALLFGPLYFFYRKVWGAALAFGLLYLALNVPTALFMLQTAGHPLFASMSADALAMCMQLASGVRAAMMVACGLFGLYFFRRDASGRIRKVLAGGPKQSDAQQSALAAAGGTSILALVAAIAVYMGLSFALGFVLLSCPNVNALLGLLGLA